jgi:Flp pilus assembly protein TadD
MAILTGCGEAPHLAVTQAAAEERGNEKSADETQTSRKVDADCVGTWLLEVPAGTEKSIWKLDLQADGRYEFSIEGPGNPPGHRGTIELGDGQWKMHATSIDYDDHGTYKHSDPDTLLMVGKLGPGVWRRSKGAADTAAGAADATAASTTTKPLAPAPAAKRRPVNEPVAANRPVASREPTGGLPPLDTLVEPKPAPAGVSEYAQGLDAIESGKCAEAIEPLSAAIDADEENARYFAARGVARLLAQQVPAGIKDLERATRLDPTNDDTKRMLSFGHRLLGDERAASGVRPPTAGDGLDRFLLETGNDYGRLEKAKKINNPQFLEECRQRRKMALTKFAAIGDRFAKEQKRQGDVGRALFARGVDRFRRGELAGAQSDLQAVLASAPDETTALYYHACCLHQLGNLEGARQELTMLLTAKLALVDAYLERAKVAAALGDLRRAQSDLATARRLDPSDPAGWQAEAARVIAAAPAASGDPPVLLDALTKAAQVGADWPELVKRADQLAAAGAARRLRGDERYQDRRLQLELARYADPKNADRLAAIGLFLLAETDVHGECVEPNGEWRYYRPQSPARKQAELAESGRLFDRALAIDRRHVGAFVGKATLAIRNMQWADAENILRVALADHADAPELLDLMSQVMQAAADQRAGKAADLRQVRSWTEFGYGYTVFFTRYPSLAERDRADAYDAAAGRFVASSRQYIERAISGMAGTAEGLYHQALLDRSDGKFEQARTALEQAVKLEATSARTHYALSGVYARLGQTEQAIEEQATAKNLEATSAAPWLQRAWSKIVSTAFKSARESLARAAQLDAADARIPAYLGILAEANDKPEEAAAFYRAAMALEEAHARLRGDTVQPGGDGLAAVRRFGLTMALRLKLAKFVAEKEPGQAAQMALANVAVEPRISEWAWGRRLSSAMLPEAGGDTRAEPFPPQLAVLMAQSRLAAGRYLIASNKPQEATAQFAPVLDYPGKLHEGGTIYLDDYLDWARLGLCEACIRSGDTQGALRWQSQVRGREFENPIEVERMRLRGMLGRGGRNRS